MKKKIDVLGMIMVIVVVVAIIAALALLTMLLWNWIMPKAIFLCNTITFWQATGLLVISSLLTIDKSKLFSWLYE